MRTYIGWWRQAKGYTDREDVPRSETPDTVEGAVQIRYDNLSKSKIKTTVVEMEKITQVIEVDTKVNIKPDDRVKTENGWLKVEQTENYLPPEKEAIVKVWQNRRTALEVKRVYLT
jgi:hypothetical protein